MNDVISD